MKKRGPRGRNFTPDERSLMLKIARLGGTVDEINEELRIHQSKTGLTLRIISDGSFDMLKNVYLKHVMGDDSSKEHIFHPAPMGKLKARVALQKEKS